MRQSPAFFAVFASLALLPACQKLEDRAEASALSKAQKTVGMSGLGGSFTEGPCPDFPTQVPPYSGAAHVGCISFDFAKAETSPTLKALGIAKGQATSDENLKLSMLTFATSDDRKLVRENYERRLVSFQKSSDLPDALGFYPIEDFETFASPDDGLVVVVGFSPNKAAAPGKTPVIVATLVKPST